METPILYPDAKLKYRKPAVLTHKFKILRAFNILSLMIFGLVFSLNYILMGFVSNYVALHVFSALYAGFNHLLLNLGHAHKEFVLLHINKTVYAFSGLMFLLCMIYTLIAYVHLESSSYESTLAKWMLSFIACLLVLIASFVLYAKEYKDLYIDQSEYVSASDDESKSFDSDRQSYDE